MFFTVVPQAVRDLPDLWRRRVAERRQLTKIDPAADALEKAAQELEATIAAATDINRLLSTADFGALIGVKQGTVRKWCARGLLPGARKNGSDDWVVPASATRFRKRRTKPASM